MLMVFAVIFALIIISQIFLFKKAPATQPKTERREPRHRAAATTTQSATPANGDLGGSRQAGDAATGRSRRSEVGQQPKPKLQSRTICTSIVFTNRGGQVKSWILKKYKDEDGHPLDLVNKETVKFGLPLSLYTYDPNLRNQINSALYVASSSGNLSAPGELDI